MSNQWMREIHAERKYSRYGIKCGNAHTYKYILIFNQEISLPEA